MSLLVAEGAALWPAIKAPYFDGSIISSIGDQFRHHPWNGLRFWNLVALLYVYCGGCMPISLGKRWARGDSWNKTFKHVLYQSFMLLFLGVMIQSAYAGRIAFKFGMF